jgi:hypothetical protein
MAQAGPTKEGPTQQGDRESKEDTAPYTCCSLKTQRSKEIYELAKVKLPYSTSGKHNEQEAPVWRYFVESHFLPLNAQMAELIQSKIYLVEEDELST